MVIRMGCDVVPLEYITPLPLCYFSHKGQCYTEIEEENKCNSHPFTNKKTIPSGSVLCMHMFFLD